MSYRIEINKQHRVLRIVVEGEVSDAEIREAQVSLGHVATSEGVESGYIDLSAVTDFNPSSATIRYLADNEPIGDIPRCIVAPSDYVFGLARMFQLMSDDRKEHLYVVRTVKDAFEKLGLPGDMEFEPVRP